MIRLLISLILFYSFVSTPLTTFAAQLQQEKKGTITNDFFSDRKRGWFAYEVMPDDNETEETEEQKPLISSPTETQQKQFKKPEIDWNAVWVMHPEQFQQLITDTKDWAVKEPTPANVKDFLQLQDVAAERAKRFMSTFTLVSQTNPQLSREADFNSSAYAKRYKTVRRKERELDLLSEYGDRYGLLYFYQPNCLYCDKQSPALKFFQEKSGWNLVAINAKEDLSGVQRFGIQTTPSIVLVKRDSDKHLMISSGIITSANLFKRTFNGIKYLENGSVATEFGRETFQESELYFNRGD